MWATTVRDTVLHHAQIAYILCALAFTLAFGVWHYRSRATVPPENRRVAAFVAICAQLFAYNLFRLAAICQGIAGRVRDGTAASAHARTMAAQVEPLAAGAWSFARKAGA